jgi:putative nucleotidyltransferase with HDIG domain
MKGIMEKARKVAGRVGDFPPIPTVILESIKLLNDPSATVKTIQEQILLDQSLTAFILKVANSALYGLMREVTTVSYAINLMGYNTTKSILTAYLSKNLYSARGGKLLQNVLWRHSISTAVLGKTMAEQLAMTNPEEVFIAGLLHDIGKGVLLKNKTDDFEKIVQLICNDKKTSLQAEQEVLGFTHVEVGYLLMQDWRFSERIMETLVYHHNILGYRGDNYMAPVVSLANKSSHRLDYSFDKPWVELTELPVLQMTEKTLAEIEAEAEEEITNYLEVFG